MRATYALQGICAYEFRMQVRRPAVWIATLVTTLILVGVTAQGDAAYYRTLPPLRLVATLAGIAGYFLPIIFGILLSDRLPREHRLKTAELLESLPAGVGVRLWGKYLGAAAAGALASLAGYLLVALAAALRLGEPALIPALLPVFALVVLPGLLFVAAFSIVCPAFLPVPLYAVLFTGYWFWGNLVPPSRAPTLSCTPLTPIGKYASVAFFQARGQECAVLRGAGVPQGLASIALLLAVAGLVVVLAQVWLGWRAAGRLWRRGPVQ